MTHDNRPSPAPIGPLRSDRDAEEFLLAEGVSGTLDHPGAVQDLRDLVLALTAETGPAERVGFDAAMASYRRAFVIPAPDPKPLRRRPMLSILGGKAAVVLAGLTVGLGATAAAAATGSLPDAAQNAAHDAFGAPAATADQHGKKGETATPKGPDATGSAAYGLCTAWSHLKDHGSKAEQSVAFRNLSAAAGGDDKVDAYCATVPHPGATSHPGSSARPTGQPTALPTNPPSSGPTSHPTAEPTSHQSGSPASVPTPTTTGHRP